jgi:hypothetical protein
LSDGLANGFEEPRSRASAGPHPKVRWTRKDPHDPLELAIESRRTADLVREHEVHGVGPTFPDGTGGTDDRGGRNVRGVKPRPPIPLIELMDQFGEMVSLHDFCDNVVYVVFAAFW